MAEARTQEQPLNAGRWRLRLIGNNASLLAPKNKAEIVSSFEIRDAREYYMPNENKTIMRYKATVQDDHLTTLQITTSKPDVYIKFSVYDNGEELVSVVGKGTALIPAFIFLKDRADTIDLSASMTSRPGSIKQNASNTSNSKISKAVSNTSLDGKPKEIKGKRSSSANSNELKDKEQRNLHSVSKEKHETQIDLMKN